MKRRSFLLQSGVGLAASALPAWAQAPAAAASAAHEGAVAPGKAAEGHKSFVHPGILQTRVDLEFMKAKIIAGEEPWKTAWDNWLKEPGAALDFDPKPVPHVIRGAYGAGQKGGQELMASSGAVNIHVLQWYVTGNEANAKKAIAILDAWSSTLVDFFENDAMLLSGWTGGEFCNAAEILRATYPGWSAASQLQFKKMLLTVYVPLLRGFYPQANGNWDAAIMYTLLSIGIHCENRELMDEVYHHYRVGPVNSGITRYIYPSGQCEETTRDQGHVQLGLGYLARTCLVAWNQGVDLFGEAENRLALGYEYTSRLLLGEDVPVFGTITQPGHGRFSDIYEIVLQHYRYEKHIDLPFTAKAAEQAMPRAHSVITAFRGEAGKAPANLRSAPAASKVAVMAGVQAKASSAAPAPAITVKAGESIQDALDQIAKSGSGTVSLGAGLHTLPATLRLPSGVTIVGTGRDCEVFLDPSKGQFEAAIVNAEPDMHDVTLRDFVIEGAQAPQAPADPNGDVGKRMTQRGPIRAGIVLQAYAKSTLRNLRFEHLTARNCTYSAVEIFGAEHVDIVNCDFAGSGGLVPPGPGKNHNLKLNHVSHVTVSGTRLSDSLWGHGLHVSFGDDVAIHDCEIARNALDGVAIAESKGVTVEGCLLEGNGGAGIVQLKWMNANQGVVVRGNTLRNNAISS